MATSIARVGSVALTELKADLTCLSKTLHQIYELMNADMRQVNAAWQDGKYQEFVQNYQPQIQKCEEIANRYADWCTRVLDPTIENVISVERTDVGGGGGSVGGVSPADMAGGAAAVTAVSGAGVAGGFNLGNSQSSPQKPSSKVAADIDAFLNKPATGMKKNSFSEADKACVDKFGEGYHGVPSTEQEAHVHFGGTTGNNQVTSGLEVDLGILKGKLGSEANSGTETSESWARCVKD